VLTLLTAAVFWNTAEFYTLLARRELKVSLPFPLSLFVFAALVLILWVNARSAGEVPGRRKYFGGIVALLLVCVAGFPFAQMICFGKTDYRRAADVAVVFGARVYKDGRPSDALADRVKTACELYRGGLVKKLIFSGGPGDGAITESESMRRMAVGLGVSAEDILTDNAGLNTDATIRNTKSMFPRVGARKVLVVSHFYHLPRIKLAYQRAGWEVYTVPAKESHFILKMPYFLAREVPALWVYYFRPLAS
jgi:vancomycin permeability regulator SanA